MGAAGTHRLAFDATLTKGQAYTPYALLEASNGSLSAVKAGAGFVYEGLSCLPAGWTCGDIGTTETPGASASADGRYTVAGSGTDIWHVADGFHYAYRRVEGDVEMVARVASLQSADAWAKAGLMLRGSLEAGAHHVFICTTPGQDTNQFVRSQDGATTSVATHQPAQSWLKLVRKGKWVATYCSADGVAWEKVGTSVELRGQEFPYVGFAVCGHGSGTATAVFERVAFATPDSILNLSDLGIYFDKKAYTPTPIPQFSQIRAKLPRPVLDDNPEWVDMYYKAWEIGFSHIKRPPVGSPLVSNFYDEAFDSHIFQWDMLFMTIFGRYAEHVFPGIESLDNFYCRQHESGCITRCLTEATGEDNGSEDSDNIINPPLFSWAEMLNYRFTADTSRLKRVFPVLEKYEAFVERKRNGNDTPHKLYWNNGQASGMDNLPRDIGRENLHHASDHQGWADMSAHPW